MAKLNHVIFTYKAFAQHYGLTPEQEEILPQVMEYCAMKIGKTMQELEFATTWNNEVAEYIRDAVITVEKEYRLATVVTAPVLKEELAEFYQALCLREGKELDWTPEECGEYNSRAELERDLRAQWKEEGE
jgi:hypothetical protein